MTMFASQWLANAGSDYDTSLIGNSVWLDSSDYLSRSTSSHSSNEVTMACWFRILPVTGTGGYAIEPLMSIGSNAASGAGNSTLVWEDGMAYFSADGYAVKSSTNLIRDIGWYHILASWKLDESTASNKGKLFVNGVEITSFSLDQRSSWATTFSNTSNQLVGAAFAWTGQTYIAQPVMLDGQSIQGGDFSISDFVDTKTFAPNDAQIVPKADADIAALASSAGGNSFCLDFSDSSALGNDISSNNNDLTATSMAAANQSANTPSKVYPIWNPLEPTNSTITLTEGNLRASVTGGSDGGSIGTIAFPTSGTSEFQIRTNNGYGSVGIIAHANAVVVDEPSNNAASGAGVFFNAAYHYVDGGKIRQVISSGHSYLQESLSTWSSNDVITVRYNADDNELNFLLNNSAIGSTVSTVAGLTYYPVICRWNNYDITAYFDSSDFPHTIGTGNKEINSANLTTETFSNPATGSFKGNASTDGPLIFLGFKPSLDDALTINSNSVTYGTDVRLTSDGFKVISSSSNFNTTSGTNSYSIVTANALQINGKLPPAIAEKS
jgi:hypothetical protein